MAGDVAGWIFVGLLAAHVALVPYMVIDLARRHKVSRMTRSGLSKPSTVVSILMWYGIVGAPLLGEIVWSQMRKLPPTSS